MIELCQKRISFLLFSLLQEEVYDVETALLPVPASELMEKARTISKNIGIFLPRNSNTQQVCAFNYILRVEFG